MVLHHVYDYLTLPKMPILRIVYETSESSRLIPEPIPLSSPCSSSCMLAVMNESQQESSGPSLAPEEANRIIHSHRKVRYGKLVSALTLRMLILVRVARPEAELYRYCMLAMSTAQGQVRQQTPM